MAPAVAPAASLQRAFQVGEAGLVTVDTTGDVLALVSAVPNLGWQVTSAQSTGPLDMEVVFQSASVRIQFQANLLYGNVSTSVAVSRIDTPASGGSTSPSPAASNGTNSGEDSYEGGTEGGQDD